MNGITSTIRRAGGLMTMTLRHVDSGVVVSNGGSNVEELKLSLMRELEIKIIRALYPIRIGTSFRPGHTSLAKMLGYEGRASSEMNMACRERLLELGALP